MTKRLLQTLKEDKSEELTKAVIANWHAIEEDFYKRRNKEEGAYMEYNSINDKIEVQWRK